MATGVLLGPLFHLVDPSKFEGVTHGFGTLALILILFEAGLELEVWEAFRHFPGAFALAVFSYVFTAGLIALVARYTLALPLHSALIVGAVLGGVSSSVTLPVLQHLSLRPKIRTTLVIEAALADILSVLAVTALLVMPAHGSILAGVAQGFFVELGISLVFGVAAGIGWSFLLPALSDQRFWQVLTFGAVLVLYAVSAVAGGGPLLAVLVFGLTLSNAPEARKRLGRPLPPSAARPETDPHATLLAFHAELSFLVRTFFFVLIGLVVRFSAFSRQWIAVAGIFGAILVGRWLAVSASRLVWRDTHPRERELAVWLLPRGLITAVLALEAARVRGGAWDFLLDLAFAAIVLTNLFLMIATFHARRLSQLVEVSETASSAQL
jgi:cell volume regulation protein A